MNTHTHTHIYIYMCVPKGFITGIYNTHTHTHTHTCMYIYIIHGPHPRTLVHMHRGKIRHYRPALRTDVAYGIKEYL